MSVETITELANETATVLESFQKEVTTAQSFQDPDLQPHAIAAKREALQTTARTRATEALDEIASRAASTAKDTAQKLADARPRIAEDPAALISAEQAWNYDVRPLIEAGAPVKNVLREASLDELLAIERFGVGYLRAAKLREGGTNPLELDPDELLSAVNNRLAMLLPEDQRTAFEDGVRVADAGVKLQQIHEVAADTIAGRRPSGDTEAYARARTLAVRLRD